MHFQIKEYTFFHKIQMILKTILIYTIMAKPIAPTPPLKGETAIDFLREISKNKKVSPEERERIRKGAQRIKSMLTFNF